jgi:Na+/H+-dicarboxylate symporter
MANPWQALSSNTPLAAMTDYLSKLVEGKLWLQVLIGMLLGLVVGVLIGPDAGFVDLPTSLLIGNWLAFPGQLFLVTIQMIVVPLVFASIIKGLTDAPDLGQLRRLGLWATSFFVVTTALAATLGIQIASLIKPGQYVDIAAKMDVAPAADALATPPPTPPGLVELPEVLIGLLPGNPLNAMAEGQMLQVVLFAFIVGVAMLSLSRDSSKPMLDLLDSLQQICMAVVRWAMTIAPIAVFGLMAQLTSRTGWQTLIGLSVYVATVIAGLLLMFALYLVLLRLFSNIGALEFLRKARSLLLLAFSTSSSAAVMPLSMQTAIEELGIRRQIAQFVIPLGATINMNGTALYQAVATVFLAQVFDIEIGTGGLALIVAMAVGASIGSPATPGVGIVILASIVSTVGIPPAGVALIIGVDRLLDMSRTAVNVAGDLVTCAFVQRWTTGEAAAIDTVASDDENKDAETARD